MKRSAQVALVLMSTATVGGVGYAMMPRQNCVPTGGAPPSATAPNAAVPNAAAPKSIGQSCTSSSAWGSYFHSGRPIFGMWNNSSSSSPTRTNFTSSDSGTSTTTTTSRTAVAGTARGGFGSTSSSVASHGG